MASHSEIWVAVCLVEWDNLEMLTTQDSTKYLVSTRKHPKKKLLRPTKNWLLRIIPIVEVVKKSSRKFKKQENILRTMKNVQHTTDMVKML